VIVAVDKEVESKCIELQNYTDFDLFPYLSSDLYGGIGRYTCSGPYPVHLDPYMILDYDRIPYRDIYVYIYVCINICVYLFIYIYIYIPMYKYRYIYLYIYTHICICAYI
jgi:hypothetical protein